jgi:protein-disulfide isomerase
MCAAEQDKFFEFHERMFEIQGEPQALSADGFRQVAEELELDMETFNNCISSRKYNDIISSNVRVASRAGVNSTPTFFINDELLRGNAPLATFQQSINSILSLSQ